uniref:hypothetical protein n=1 Tax=Bordetella sputigena TaxID=1416810 RepID=UPI0039F1380A
MRATSVDSGVLLNPLEWPALPSKGPQATGGTIATSIKPARSADRRLADIVPHGFPMGRTSFHDLNGDLRHPTGRVGATETVWTTGQILTAAAKAPVPPEGDLPLFAYFDVAVDMGADAVVPEHGDRAMVYRQVLTQYVVHAMNHLEKSPTMRKLIRMAVAQGRLSIAPQGRWVAKVAQPDVLRSPYSLHGFESTHATYVIPFQSDPAQRVLTLPPPISEPIGGRYYLAPPETGTQPAAPCRATLRPRSVQACMIRAMVSSLTGVAPSLHMSWMDAQGEVDPRRIGELGVGERGAVDALTQRIGRELNLPDCAWLSPLPFGDGSLVTPPGRQWPEPRLNDAVERALDAIGGVDAVRRYVAAQDEYLESRYPLRLATASLN